jgi:hypothetical protein
VSEARLRTKIWIQAQVRICDLNALPVAVAHRGDPDAGTVLLRLNRGAGRSLLLRRSASFDGAPGWMVVAGTDEIEAAAADAYIARERTRDRDLWVLEIEDVAGRYPLDAPILRRSEN